VEKAPRKLTYKEMKKPLNITYGSKNMDHIKTSENQEPNVYIKARAYCKNEDQELVAYTNWNQYVPN